MQNELRDQAYTSILIELDAEQVGNHKSLFKEKYDRSFNIQKNFLTVA